MSERHDIAHQAAEIASAVAPKVTVAGGGVAGVGGFLLSSEGIAVAGLCIALAGFAVQAILGIRRDRREKREHEARMSKL